MKLKKQGIWTSYVIGLPTGLIAILIVILIPAMLAGEALATMAMFAIYGKAIAGLTCSFILALGIAGHFAFIDFEKQKGLVNTSFKYSFTVNSIIWTVFIMLTILDNFDRELVMYLLAPIMLFLLCTAITTFTTGILICLIIRRKVKAFSAQM